MSIDCNLVYNSNINYHEIYLYSFFFSKQCYKMLYMVEPGVKNFKTKAKKVGQLN